MARIEAIVFDMDGVLIDAREWHYEALNRALKLFGYQINRYEHLAMYDGLPTRRKLEMLSVERGLPRVLHDFINEMKQQYTMEKVFTDCRPRFQHEFALARLRQAGYRLAVASNSIRATVDIMMKRSGLDRFLELTLSNEDVKRPKPDPEIYIAAMKRLGVAPQACLVVEDNANGVAAARAAGAHVMEVAGVEHVNLRSIEGFIAGLTKARAA